MGSDAEVYARLYDEVEGNLSKAGKSFEYRKSTFLCDVMSHPQEIDVSGYLNLPNTEFMEAIYVAALKRLPDDRTKAFWAKRYQLPTPQFQEEVLKCIAGSSVVAINQIRLENNPYFRQKRGLKYKALGLLYGLTDKSYLREFGKKLPAPVQKIIRKLFL
ncbi:MAG: hypothetical protein HDR38_06455 [Treponema sp.]|nr:hypothetical protein [Treponema sp.]